MQQIVQNIEHVKSIFPIPNTHRKGRALNKTKTSPYSLDINTRTPNSLAQSNALGSHDQRSVI